MTARADVASLVSGAVAALRLTDPTAKGAAVAALVASAEHLPVAAAGDPRPPDRPGRPERPVLLPPSAMPRRRLRGESGRIALLHAVAHIELNAVDLALDILARFGAGQMRGFALDWLKVAADEARHFGMVAARLEALGAAYGDLPAHDGLWQASRDTAGDLLARLAVVPMVFEARGLDVTPPMIQGLLKAGDADSAAILEVIATEEVAHVATGLRWFDHLARTAGLEPVGLWHRLVRAHYGGALKRPFNVEGRAAAGMSPDWYEPLAEG